VESPEGARSTLKLAPGPRSRAVAAAGFDPFTAMTSRFGRLARAFGRRFFAEFDFEPGIAERLRELEEQGAVVFVMRYGSRLDYFLFNWLFLAAGLRLSSFANGIRFYYYRPLPEALRLLWHALGERLRRGYPGMRARSLAHARATLAGGGSMFLFLRTDKIGSRIAPTRQGALVSGRSEHDFLEELVHAEFEAGRPVRLVPLALFWRKGPRVERRFLNLFYGAPERPTDTGKVISFLWNYKNLAVRVGQPIDLEAFVRERRAAGESAAVVARKVRRALMIFLRREEKPVAGAALRPLLRVEQLVLADPEVRRAIAEEAVHTRRAPERVQHSARRMLREIAAAPSPTMLAALDVLVTRILGRLFERIEVSGLERIVEAAKLHPLVLIPCHRSHIDYVILSWLFYEHHLVPPLVAAGINLAFWPLGPIFRRAGAFFLRRTFDGDRLYATVFRTYVMQLLRDGATQEFFIEGTRSRTGRTLPPRLGMLSMVVEAYARGVRSDVRLVPIGFSYERVVEEASLVEERRGAGKTGENLSGLLRARRLLRRRFGRVVVRFGESISLAEVIGPSRPQPGPAPAAEVATRREKTAGLAREIARQLSELVAAGRTHVAAAALLASPAEGVRREEFVRRARLIAAALERSGAAFGEALREDLAGDLAGTLRFLEEAELVTRVHDREGEIVQVGAGQRVVLDYYRNAISAPLAPPAALALALRLGRTEDEALAAASDWLDVLRAEFFPPPRERLAELCALHAGALRALGPRDGAAARGWIELFSAQIVPTLLAYRAVWSAVLDTDGHGEVASLLAGARERVRRALLLGESRHPEAENPSALENALAFLIEEHVLRCDAGLRKRGARLAPGPRFEELEGLAARLASAVPG
jgi:glycerol-3-phosphate O-acyltransferase